MHSLQDAPATLRTRDESSGASEPDAIDLTDDVDMTSHEGDGRSSRESDSRAPEVVRSDHREVITLQCDLSAMESSWVRFSRTPTTPPTSDVGGIASRDVELTRDAGLENDDDAERADAALSRVIEKADFSTMDVVGQFNLGFIIARHRKHSQTGEAPMDDLFIVDQHAADEKYNFETLQKTTKIESQKLLTCVLHLFSNTVTDCLM